MKTDWGEGLLLLALIVVCAWPAGAKRAGQWIADTVIFPHPVGTTAVLAALLLAIVALALWAIRR
jgi:hypothetical protein